VGGKIVYEVGYKVGAVDHAYILSETGDVIQEKPTWKFPSFRQPLPMR